MDLFTKEIADKILDMYAEIWMKIDVDIQYLASVKKNDSDESYFIEKGVLKNGKLFTGEVNTYDLFFPKDPVKISSISSRNEEYVEPNKKEVQEIIPLNINNHKIRPYLSGCKIENHYSGLNEGGTLGAILKIKNNNQTYLISNFHVLSSTEKLNSKELIFQPSKLYGKKTGKKKLDYSNVIALLRFGRYGDSIREDGSLGNTLDVAFAQILDKNMASYGFTGSIKTLEAEEAFLKSYESPKDQMKITIHGKTSGVKESIIRSTNAYVKVKHSYEDGKTITFKNQILLEDGVGKEGDSGSVLVNNNNNIVGLLHAGDKKNVSFANNIDHIFNHIYKIPAAKDQKIIFDQFLT